MLSFREKIMTKSVLFIAIAAFALSASSAEAAKKKTGSGGQIGSGTHLCPRAE